MATDLPMDQPTERPVSRLIKTGAGLVVCAVAIMWAVEVIDTLLLSDRLQGNGIHPRRIDGLDGVLTTPFLHGSFGHLVSNSVPFVVLGWLVAVRGVRYWLAVTAIVVLVGGGLTWLLASGGNHIGASGVVFGYFGALVGAAFTERKPAAMALALVAILMYGTILAGIVPQQGISWEGHLFGLLAGIAAGRGLARPRPSRTTPADPDAKLYPWEEDEPWRQ